MKLETKELQKALDKAKAAQSHTLTISISHNDDKLHISFCELTGDEHTIIIPEEGSTAFSTIITTKRF